jgi:uncharacterized protein YdgA (DUF945 family)
MENKPKLQIPLVAVIALVVSITTAAYVFTTKLENKTTQATEIAASAPQPIVAAPAAAETTANTSNVKVEEYLQTIEISAKGGYQPLLTVAKANLPVVINITTNETYDCSTSVVIPSINYRARLPFTGTTTVNMAPQQPNTEIVGTCGMGMYSFKIKFAG